MAEAEVQTSHVRHPSANGMIYIRMSQAMHIRNEKNVVTVGVQFAGRREKGDGAPVIYEIAQLYGQTRTSTKMKKNLTPSNVRVFK